MKMPDILAPLKALILSRVKMCADFISSARISMNPWERDRNLSRAALEIDLIADLLNGEKPKEEKDVEK